MFALGLILSLAIGLSLGLLGGGGSILTVPVLHYALGLGVHEAIAGSLVVVAVTSSIAVIPYARSGRVQWRIGLVFGAASMAAAFAGGRLGARLPGGVLIAAFALVMIAAGAAMLLRSRRALGLPVGRPVRTPRVLAVGLGVGLVTGVLGAGGGFVIVPALTLLGGLAMCDAVGTSLLVIAMNALAGLAGGALHTHVDVRTIAAVTGLAVIGSLAGARVGRRVSAHRLQQGFGGFVLAVAAAILLGELV
ncbi:MAG TPA: sulfite exporter TauE/SafE family protein [Kofleriaceae bacterium]